MVASCAVSLEQASTSKRLVKIPVRVSGLESPEKPSWMRKTLKPDDLKAISLLKKRLRERTLVTVCEEANCPNLSECFALGTATFMILGDTCTRRCTFCSVKYGQPQPPDPLEPQKIADAIEEMQLRYVVITSVDRDDLQDGGAQHFADVLTVLRTRLPQLGIEFLVPDFRGRWSKARGILMKHLPDVLAHNIETVPRLYAAIRPGASYEHSLNVLMECKNAHPHVRTKSGLMLGLGEQQEELFEVFEDLRKHGVDGLTLGQYLPPSPHHAPLTRYIPPEEFEQLRQQALSMGFRHVASGPWVRSSYHAHLMHTGAPHDSCS